MILAFILGIAFLIFVTFFRLPQEILESSEIQPIKLFMVSCLEDTSKQAFYILGLQNGIDLNDYTIIGEYKINYAYHNESKALTLNEIEEQVAEFIEENIPKCINSLEDFPQAKLEDGKLNIDVISNRNDVVIEADYNAYVEINNGRHKIGEFQTRLPLRISKIQDALEYIANNYPEIELYSYLGELDMNVSIYPVGDMLYYMIADEKSKLDNKNYKYAFALG